MPTRTRAGERRLLHPDRLLRLWRGARWSERLVAVGFGLVAVVGVILVVAPVSSQLPHPAPPPMSVPVDCPPAFVAAVAGAGGITSPFEDVEAFADRHDRVCADEGRRLALTGGLMVSRGR